MHQRQRRQLDRRLHARHRIDGLAEQRHDLHGDPHRPDQRHRLQGARPRQQRRRQRAVDGLEQHRRHLHARAHRRRLGRTLPCHLRRRVLDGAHRRLAVLRHRLQHRQRHNVGELHGQPRRLHTRNGRRHQRHLQRDAHGGLHRHVLHPRPRPQRARHDPVARVGRPPRPLGRPATRCQLESRKRARRHSPMEEARQYHRRRRLRPPSQHRQRRDVGHDDNQHAVHQ